LKTPSSHGVANGNIIKGWETVHNIVTSVHSNPRNQSFRLDQQIVDVRVINSVTAFVVAEGKFIDVPTKDGTTTENFALTMLMEKIDGKWVSLDIWNFFRREEFISCNVSGQGAFIMFDLTSNKSFACIPEYSRLIHEKLGNIPILLLGNHSEDTENRKISAESAVKQAKNLKLKGYCEISTKMIHKLIFKLSIKNEIKFFC